MLRDASIDALVPVVPPVDGAHTARILVIGDAGTADVLRTAFESPVDVRFVTSSDESEGIDIDVVVIAGSFPLDELAQVRVHPRLADVPAVVVMGGRYVENLDRVALNAALLSEATRGSLAAAVVTALRMPRSIV